MGLYIAGLRMPKPGTYTKFTVYSDGRVVLHFGGKYIGDAVEIKDPHGRLIDADALDADLERQDMHTGEWDAVGFSIKEIENAPTIIEAEGKK